MNWKNDREQYENVVSTHPTTSECHHGAECYKELTYSSDASKYQKLLVKENGELWYLFNEGYGDMFIQVSNKIPSDMTDNN